MIILGEHIGNKKLNKIRVFLKLGGAFNVFVIERVFDLLTCICDDGEEITIDIDDIDFIVDLGNI